MLHTKATELETDWIVTKESCYQIIREFSLSPYESQCRETGMARQSHRIDHHSQYPQQNLNSS
jgi:hypothetical protein